MDASGNMTTEIARPGTRATAMGADATAKLGPGAVSSLDAISKQKAEENRLKLSDIRINQMVKIDEQATRITKEAFAEKDKYERLTGEKYPRNAFMMKIKGAQGLWKVAGRDFDPSQYESMSEFMTTKRVQDEKDLAGQYEGFLKKPTPEGASTLLKLTTKMKQVYGGTDGQYAAIDDAVKKFNTEQVKPPRDKFRTFAGPGGSRLQVNETTGEEKTVLGRHDESGAGATAKQGRLNNSYKIYDEKWVEIAKQNLGSDSKAIQGLFTSDELGGGVNSGRLRNALTPEQRKNYDWGKKRLEVHAVGSESAEAVDRALTEIQKAYKGGSPAPSKSSGGKSVKQKISAQRPGGGGQQPQASSAPPVKYLKEGQQTTFKNGEVWTLQNGKPVRIK
jgi:hypothetical protein